MTKTNKIGYINECALWTEVSIEGVILNVEERTKNNKEPFLMLTIADCDDTLTFPIWDNIESRKAKLEVGKILTVVGAVNEYQGERQVKPEGFQIRELTDEEKHKFIPSYEIKPEVMDWFLDNVNGLEPPYRDIVQLALGIHPGHRTEQAEEKWRRFTTAPAAVKHHHNKLCGLFNHTAGLLYNVNAVIDLYIDNPFFLCAKDVINPSRLRAGAILHDVCKVYEYSYDTHIGYADTRFDHRLMFMNYVNGINELSFRVTGTGLTTEELEELQELILTHHGPWGGYKPKNLESLILFLVDMMDSQIVGCIEQNNPNKVRMTLSSMLDAE